jgi:hypothetical protein
MPDNPWLWGLAILVVAVVLVVALRRGGKVEAGVGPTSLKFEARREPDGSEVSVLDRGEIRDATVGDVTGVEADGGPGPRKVDVGRGARVTGSTVGDITGVRTGGERKPDA